ncbi:MAG: hypothetical protein NVSMB29_02430 [Candidatus Dormibacteria bacterium]
MPGVNGKTAAVTPAAGQQPATRPSRGLARIGSRALLPLSAALLAVTGMALAGLSLRGGHDVVVGANTPVTGAGPSALIDANNSPTVLINPRRSDNLVAVNRVDRPLFSGTLHWSSDHGRSWADTALPLPVGRDRPYAPDAAFDPQGRLYVLYVNLEGRGNDPQSLWLARSGDGGKSLDPPVEVAGRLSFQPRLAVDGHQHVYVTWLRAANVGTLTITGPAALVCATSDDGGLTFGAPVQVSDPQRQRVGAATPVVEDGGDLAVLYEDFRGDVRDFQNLDGPPWPGPFALVVARSTTRGKSFAQGVEIDAGLVPTERFLVYLPRFPSIAAGPGGILCVAWSDGRTGAEQVFVRRSSDGGRTWRAATQISGGPPGPGVSAWLPKVSVAPNGRVDVLFLAGHRNTGDGLVDAYLATADDPGASFQTVRVSTSSFSSRIGPLTGPTYLAPDLGSKVGADGTRSEVVVAWVDTRLGNENTGRQDIFVARVGLPRAGPSRLQLAVAGLLLFVAAALLVPVFRRMRGRGWTIRERRWRGL